MRTVVALLRGVNVGGNAKIKMDALRDICASLGFTDAKTYVQSGNVVFRTKHRNPAATLEDAIEQQLGFRPAVLLRTAADLRSVVERNPFPGIEGNKLLVTFFTAPISDAAASAVASVDTGVDKVQVSGREILIHFPEGMGRSKTPVLLERAFRSAGAAAQYAKSTTRNWNTVLALLEMAEASEASA